MIFDEYRSPALKTALYFFIFGFFWILLSDEVLHQLSPTLQIESQLQTYKGWFFILVTTILIYLIVKQQIREVIDLKNRLLLSEKNLSAVLENIGEGIITTDADGRIVEMNRIAESLTGVSEATARGKKVEETLRVFEKGKSNNLSGELLQKPGTKAGPENPYLLESSHGKSYHIYFRSDNIIDKNGNVRGKLLAFKDMTANIAYQEALRKSEKRYKEIVEITHDLIWSVDTNAVITFMSDSSKAIYGLDPGEMIGRPFTDFVSESQFNERQQKFNKRLEQGISFMEFETEIIRQDGKKVYLKDNIIANFDESGNYTGVSGASKDITRDKLNEQALIENKERLELALQGGDLGLWDYNLKTRKIIINDKWKEILGFDFSENIIDEDFFSGLVHPDDVRLVNNAFSHLRTQDDKLLDFEFRIKHKDGRWLWLLSKGKVVRWESPGTPLRIIGAIIDLTEKKKLELELQHWVDIYRSFIKYSGEGIYLYEMDKPMPVTIPPEKQVKNFYHQGYIRTCNDSFAKMYGYRRAQDMEGMDLKQLHGGDDIPENLAFLRKFIESGYRIRHEVSKEKDREGNTIYISNNVVGIKENNMLVRVWGSQSNITDQVIAQQKLEYSERRYRLLFETNPAPLVIFDLNEFQIYDANNAAEELLGYRKDELLTFKIWDIRPEISLFTKRELKGELIRELAKTAEIKLKSSSGRIVQAEAKLDQIDFDGNQALLMAINDLTALKEAEKRVIQSLIEGENNERRRIAKEIHDSLGQSLTAASLNFSAAKNTIENMGFTQTDKIEAGMNFLKNAIEESRNIAHNLMPNAIEDFGLIPSLKSLFNQIEKSSGIKISLYNNFGSDMRLNKQIELNLYRITQEALNNAIKHAGATEIFVQLVLHKNEIIFTFEDNGRGFNIADAEKTQKGMGLKSIYNRVKAMSGRFEIDSVPGQGTSITIQLPV